MSFRRDAVNKAVGKTFDVIDPIKAVRQSMLRGAGTAFLILLAVSTVGVWSWLLWIWVGYRLYCLAALLIFGGDAARERERRLRVLPPFWWEYLKTGTVPEMTR